MHIIPGDSKSHMLACAMCCVPWPGYFLRNCNTAKLRWLQTKVQKTAFEAEFCVFPRVFPRFGDIFRSVGASQRILRFGKRHFAPEIPPEIPLKKYPGLGLCLDRTREPPKQQKLRSCSDTNKTQPLSRSPSIITHAPGYGLSYANDQNLILHTTTSVVV